MKQRLRRATKEEAVQMFCVIQDSIINCDDSKEKRNLENLSDTLIQMYLITQQDVRNHLETLEN